MTVRVSKPEFNLREKLSELDVPVGSHGGRIMQSSSAEETFDIVRAGRKNMIINGQMFINQRNGTSSYTIPHATGGSYGGPDRWAVNEATDGSVSVNMDGDPLNYPEVSMFSKAMQIACSGTATLSSTHNLHFFQNIEGYNIAHLGWGTRAAKPVTLSFWVKTNVPGYYCVGLENNGTDRCCIKQFHHNGSSIWQKFVLTYPGCGDGTWVTNNGCGIRLRFCLASGTQYDDGVEGQWVTTDELVIGENQVNFMSSTSNRFFITGVQLEEGSVATPFEHRPYGEELALCQRYFAVYHPTSQERIYIEGSATNHRWWEHPIPAGMRTEPAITKGGTCSTLNIGIAGSLTMNGLSTTGVDNGGSGGTTHPGSMGNVSYRVSTTGGGGSQYSVRHTDGWQNGAGWINMDCEL